MKKLINNPHNVVREMLEGLALGNSDIMLADDAQVIIQQGLADPAQRKVAVISGGGSGHEPAHAGYVGLGMLTAAVAGDVFTSPDVDSIFATIMATAGPAGAVLIVKNYTGDRLNFGLAAELAIQEGIPTEIIVVADDVALRSTVRPERSRGVAGTVFVHKIVGAAAAQGWALADVVALGRAVSAATQSMSVGLSACTIPASGQPGFDLADNEIEFGLGIHGERGVRRAELMPADDIVDVLLDAALNGLDASGARDVAVMVNGLGGTPVMELHITARRLLQKLGDSGLPASRVYVGNFMTALEMQGMSITLLRLEPEWMPLLDSPTVARAWPVTGQATGVLQTCTLPRRARPQFDDLQPGPQQAVIAKALTTVADTLTAAEDYLTELDSKGGDGDLGLSMSRGAAALRALPAHVSGSAEAALTSAAHALQGAIAGSSGPFYATALMRAARVLSGVSSPTAQQWQQAFAAGAEAITELGGARVGDRTMVDALQPAAQAWRKVLEQGIGPVQAFEAAVSAADRHARETAGLQAALGRASYLGERAIGVPDGGAMAVSIWMAAILKSLQA
ncbi:dihydroxyacetone kinase subunit DhaK [Pusillimonas sp. MFBS29]|uniref:dihydroxyacetone kinase subunit DhaL n=1 Tax=Pusillimonas sp. MFBS29 TaxID=2886690 RepID=UPI001D11A9E8|nr:dihydroxyacetone kinase subunit DhaL [Pusillimonas sp. MFBS29]MCC2595433.1 dihydroxyacetone kinase subunit DhaK [Pusillimonas sp. MFBS29]